MSILTLKILSAAAIFAVGVVGGLIPIAAARFRDSGRFFSLSNSFAGGLFLGVGFIHLLPKAMEELEEVTHYPLATLLAMVGLSLLLLIDRVIFGDQPQRTAPGSMRRRVLHPYVLLVVLSIHSAIAGVSLGLEPGVAASLVILLGILCHKGSAAFTLIASAHVAGIETGSQRVMLGIFSLMTPLGVLSGSGLATGLDGSAAALLQGCFNALAAGTFIYVAIIDIIDEEFMKLEVLRAKFAVSALVGDDDVPMPEPDRDRVLKFMLVIAGLALMGVLALMH